MDISVTGRKMVVTDALRQYATEKVGNSMKVMDISPLSANVVLHVEKNPSYSRPAVCEVTMRTKGHIIRVEEHEEDMYAAIDVAAAKVLRQLRKFKTRVIKHTSHSDATNTIRKAGADQEPDFDALMDELSDEEVVRVKDMKFEPMTEDEALLQIDLLGHDFFAYTDKDSNKVCVLYRRNDGGYGLLRQTN
jgi:putative sigma-54 modulation protein